MHDPKVYMHAAQTFTTSQPQKAQLFDQFGRKKQKLRISVTDRCNFNCHYCLPQQPKWIEKKHLLSFDQLLHFCRVMVDLGIEQIRITGGEPLLRAGLVNFIQQLQSLKPHGLRRISMSSNGYYLKQLAAPLKHAGLDDINISLDSTNAQCFQKMTGRDIRPVLAGIFAAINAGLLVKLNCVLIAGYNHDHIIPMTHWAKTHQIPLRFIEFMPLDFSQQWRRDLVVSEDEILTQLATEFKIEATERHHDPASPFILDGHYPLGIISTITHPFCQSCNRLRLTATGELYSCLFSRKGTDLKPYLFDQSSVVDAQQHHSNELDNDHILSQHILNTVWQKPAGYIAQPKLSKNRICMHMLGG